MIEFIKNHKKIIYLFIFVIFCIGLGIGLSKISRSPSVIASTSPSVIASTSPSVIASTSPSVIASTTQTPLPIIDNIINPKIFIASENSISYSEDYKNWGHRNIPQNSIANIYSLSSNTDKSLFIIVGSPYSNIVMYSTNCKDWTGIDRPHDAYGINGSLCSFYSKIINKFIIGFKSVACALATSSDGISWDYLETEKNISNLIDGSSNLPSITSICESENSKIIVAVGGQRYSNNIIWSNDSLNWHVALFSYKDGYNGAQLFVSSNKSITYYPSCVVYSNDLNLFIAGCTVQGGLMPGVLTKSKDGKIWDILNIQIKSGYTKYFGNIISVTSVFTICWSPILKLFVASAEGLTENNKLYFLMTSSDSINWDISFQSQNIKINSIYWSDYFKKFFAVGKDSNINYKNGSIGIIAYSDDGINWINSKFGDNSGVSVIGF